MWAGTDLHALFTKPPVVRFQPDIVDCPDCKNQLSVAKTRRGRKLVTLSFGTIEVHETVKTCTKCSHQTHYRSDQLTKLAPYGSTVGYDVLVYVGKARFLSCRDEQSVQEQLRRHGVSISRSEIGYLARKFIVYLAIAHARARKSILNRMRRSGGYILHLDGTSEADSPHLFSALDGLNEIVLDNIKMSAESTARITPFLQRIKQAYGTPIALVHDMSPAILKAVTAVFPKVADFVCHFHFLRDTGKDLLAEDNDLIRRRLRRYAIQKFIRDQMMMFRQEAERDGSVAGFILGIDELPNHSHTKSPISFTVLLYIQLAWILDGKRQGSGYGFPFDRVYCSFYSRIIESYKVIDMLNRKIPSHLPQRKQLGKVWKKLKNIAADKTLKQTATRMQEKAKVFDRLRKAMRITLPNEKNGLNDKGDKEMNLIKRQLSTFRKQLVKQDIPKNPEYQKLLNQLDKYWDKLLTGPIKRKTRSGTVTIYPQRTNNILEQFFRDIRRNHRQRTGNDSLCRFLKTMNAETPLVRNLQNPDYIRIICAESESLEQRFAQIDYALVSEKMREDKDDNRIKNPKIKRAIKRIDLPVKIAALITRCQ